MHFNLSYFIQYISIISTLQFVQVAKPSSSNTEHLQFAYFTCLTCHDFILTFLTSLDVKIFLSTPVTLVTYADLSILFDLIKDMFVN